MEDLTKPMGEQESNPENHSSINVENEETVTAENNSIENANLEMEEEILQSGDTELKEPEMRTDSEPEKEFSENLETVQEEISMEEKPGLTEENKVLPDAEENPLMEPEAPKDQEILPTETQESKTIEIQSENVSVEEKEISEPEKTPEPPKNSSYPENEINLEEETEEEEEEVTENYLAYTREQLVGAIEDFLKDDISAVKNKISLVKMAFYTHTNEMKKTIYESFIAEGGIKEDFQHSADELEDRFKKAIETYRERRQKYLDEIEREKQGNLQKKLQILEELKELISSEETLKKTYDEFKVLQDRWKEIGVVPRSEINNLWKNYHFLIEKFFDKVKINKELKMLDLKKNLDQKIELCEKVEELLLEPSILKSFKSLQIYREKWREIGPVPSDKNEEIWERFRTAAEQIDLRRKEYYDSLAEEYERNLLAKTALCEKAEEILTKESKTIADWNKYTTELDDLMKLWKTIGPASKTANNEIWARFKMALDTFFTNKKEFFDKLKEEQSQNYDQKMNICLQAEEIAQRNDWKRATDELLKLQKEWKEIGSVSRKVSDKLWARFREACDMFFTKKSEYFSEIRSSETENLAKKEDILKRLKEYSFTEDRNENLRVIKEFQREWMEVGFVPISEKERLQTEFRSIVNRLFEQLKISAQEVQKESFRNRLSNISFKDATRFLSKERHEIQDKIQKLKDNLKLWENNLGFLAQSKQADILRKEFDKKMQSARQEIALLEAKLKILVETKISDKNEKEEVKKPVSKEKPEVAVENNVESQENEKVETELPKKSEESVVESNVETEKPVVDQEFEDLPKLDKEEEKGDSREIVIE